MAKLWQTAKPMNADITNSEVNPDITWYALKKAVKVQKLKESAQDVDVKPLLQT